MVIAGPRAAFSPEEVVSLVEYARGGGRLLAFADHDGDVDALLNELGLEMLPGVVTASESFVPSGDYQDRIGASDWNGRGLGAEWSTYLTTSLTTSAIRSHSWIFGEYNRTTGVNTTLTIVISLIRIFSDGPEVSLRGSPTVSPTTAAL